MKKKVTFRNILALLLVLAMTIGYLPIMTNAAAADTAVVTDPGTAHTWEAIMGTSADGSRYAGRVWVDKSVYKNGDTAILNQKGDADSAFTVALDTENGEYFQTVFSALGSSMSTNTTVSANKPLDVVLVLDTSTSMAQSSGGVSRMQRMIEAANELLEDLSQLGDVRIAIVTFNRDSETVIDLAYYQNGIVLSTNSYTNTNGGGIITAKDKSGKTLGKDSGYISGTNLQDGIDRGMSILANATGVAGRAPVAIVLADGRANRAVNDDWYTINANNRQSSGDAGIMLSTLLNAAYGRTKAEKNYGAKMTVYGIGIDLTSSSNDYIFLNPGAEGSSGFNGSNRDSDVGTAWNAFTSWKKGNIATIKTGSGRSQITWTFDHDWPSGAGVTTTEVAANINYVDNYQNVSGASLGTAFDKIYEELATGAFNPISSTVNGATGVENTPLIYADNIGKYMEVRNIQAIQVFGNTYNVMKNADGSYSVAAGAGVNPTTGESWNTTRDIQINVIENADGTQQLRIYIQQQILPILLDKINVKTENNVTTSTMTSTEQSPLRVFYTVGIDSDILLPNGQVDPAKLDSDYAYVDTANGTVSFYSNAFGAMHEDDLDGDGLVELGDAHVGFVPSHNNRYYYYQAHQEIFIRATNADGSEIKWEDDLYGVRWQEGMYDLQAMTYADLSSVSDATRVYTYVTFYRPTGSGTAAEEVTYLVYATWGDMKSAATFYDKVNKVAINGGSAIDPDRVGSVVGAYLEGKTVAQTDMIAILGLQSRRVSRLHNMFRYKASNDTASAELAYAPAYSDSSSEASDIHEHSEVIVWLGNNGKVTLNTASAIQVTKTVAELAPAADAAEAFEIRVNLDLAYSAETAASLLVTDTGSTALDSSAYTVAETADGKMAVTVWLRDGETVRIYGVPGGTSYTVTEAAHEKYDFTYAGATKAVAGAVVKGIVTNEPVKNGSLYITKTVVPYKDGEPFPTDREFEFEVTFLDADGQPMANKAFQLVNNYEPELTALTTDENGVMRGKLRHGETAHILEIPAGTTVTVQEINIPEHYTSTAYSSINHSGDTADDNGTVTIVSEQNATVVVTNTYTPNPVSVDLDIAGTKNFEVEGLVQAQQAGSFTFVVEQRIGQDWVAVENKSATLTYAEGEGGSVKNFTIENVLENMTFTQAGTYAYQVREQIGTVENITYDRTLWTFTVSVADVAGQLTATITDLYNETITDGSYEVTFTNTYHTAPVSIDILKEVVDTSNNPQTSKAGFEFIAQTAEVDAEGNWSVKEGGRTFSVFSDSAGKARMTDVYKAPGSYYYIISEKAGNAPGWSYSQKQYQIEAVVTEDENGTLTATLIVNGEAVGDDSVQITFTNTYDPQDAPVDLNIVPTVAKNLKGRDIVAGEFTFAIFPNGKSSHTSTEGAVAVGVNDEKGDVVFASNMIFSKVGRYEYDVVEINGGKGGVAYDSIIYDLVIEVTDAGDGTLTAIYYFEDSTEQMVVFENTYTTGSAQVVINGTKTLQVNSGIKSLRADMFTFGLYGEDGTLIETVRNDGSGNFRFAAIEYAQADAGKTFTYTVREIAPDNSTDGSYSAGGLHYSGRAFTVTVQVIDNGDGTLTASATGNGAQNIHFVNEYNSNPVYVTLPGKKNLTGRSLASGEFRFALYQANKDFEGLTLVDDTLTHDANGDFTVTLGTLGMGTHYFVVKEVIPAHKALGIHYYAGEYHITIHVSDSGDGQMSYTQTVVNPGSPEVTNHPIVFNNLYRPEPGSIDLTGTKIISGGKPLTAGEFSFELLREEEVIAEAVVNADGSFVFEDIIFTADDIGTNTLMVREKIPAEAKENADGSWTLGSITYDTSVYTVVVTVSDVDKDGALEISAAVDGAAEGVIEFTNIHTPNPISYQLQAKKIYEKGLKGDDFSFTLEGQGFDKQTKQNDADGNILFDPVTFTAAGSYSFTVKEKKDGLLSFIRPSEAEYEVMVTVVNEDGVLRVAAVTSVNTKNTGESNLEFVNTYVMDGEVQLVLNGKKLLTGDRTTVQAGEFEFGLYDAQGTLIERVKNDASGVITFASLVFDENDVAMNGQAEFVYTVKEIAGDNARYTYDDAVYTVTVTVKDNDEGGISVSHVVTRDGAAAEITFENTYTDPNVVTYVPTAQKHYNKALTGGEFTFKLEGEGFATQEKTNDATGAVVFDALSFAEAGTYTFTIKEIDKVLGFISYSTAEHTLVVKVIDTKGVLSIASVTVNADPKGTIEFTNVYNFSGEGQVELSGTKTLTGDRTAVNAGEFTFGLYDAQGALVESVTNDASGSFAFAPLIFNETHTSIDGENTYVYTVKEIPGTNPGMTYDETVYTVTVTVKDNHQGGIAVSHEITKDGASAEIAFTNSYHITGTAAVELAGLKTYEGRKLQGNDFTFVLVEKAQELERVQNAADGTFAFAPIEYTVQDIGVHTYLISELHPEDVEKNPDGLFVKNGIIYDANIYVVEVTVADDGQGGLTVTKKLNNEVVDDVSVTFDNAYQIFGSGKLEIQGTKELTGGKPLTDGEFSFGLYENGQLVAEAVNASGNFVLTKLYTAQELGTYTYTLSEIIPEGAVQNEDGTWTLGTITYDPAVYTVNVSVSDDQLGGIAVAYEIVDAQEVVFRNTYTPEPVMITIGVQKLLDNRTDKEMSLAGFEFLITLGEQTYEAVSDEEGLTGFTVTFNQSDIGQTYAFQITEKNTGIKGMTYDKTVHTVTVEVLQNADGTLKTVIDGQETDVASVQFTNLYEKLVTPPTGDEFNMLLPIALMLLSILGVAAVLITRKKKVA